MNITTLIQELSTYPPNTEIKIVVNDIEQDIRCLIYNKDFDTLYLADATYEN